MTNKKNNNSQTFQGRQSNRRDFLKLSAMAGMVGAVCAMGMPVGSWAAQPQPKRGGVLKLGLAGSSTSDSLDPGSWSDTFTFVGFSAIYNTLVEIDVNGQAIPELAESWETSSDARLWTFKLRPGVTFHDGKTLVVEDIVASIQHHMGENSTSAAKTLLDGVVDVRARGNDQVEFELKSGNADFPYIVADYHLAIMPTQGGASTGVQASGPVAIALNNSSPVYACCWNVMRTTGNLVVPISMELS